MARVLALQSIAIGNDIDDYVFTTDSLSCASASSLESPSMNNRTFFGASSTSSPLRESSNAKEMSATPKNSRFILEKWLKSTPSPCTSSLESNDSRVSQRGALTEQRSNHITLDDSTPKRKIVLCVRPSSEPKGLKRQKATSLPLTKSSTKRKLVSEDKENPPTKTIKMCFESTRSSPKSNEAKYEPDNSREEQQTPSVRVRRPFASNRTRDILDYVDEREEIDEKTDNESS